MDEAGLLPMAAALKEYKDMIDPDLEMLLRFVENLSSRLTEDERREIYVWVRAHYPDRFLPDPIKPILRPEIRELFAPRSSAHYSLVNGAYTIEKVEIANKPVADGGLASSDFEVVPFSLQVRINRGVYPYLRFTHLYVRGADQNQFALEADSKDPGLFTARGSLHLSHRNQDENQFHFFAVDSGTDHFIPIRGSEYTVRVDYSAAGTLNHTRTRAYLQFLRDRLVRQNVARSLRIRQLQETVERIMLADFTEIRDGPNPGFKSLDELLKLSRQQTSAQLAELENQLAGDEAKLIQLQLLKNHLKTYLDPKAPVPTQPVEDIDTQLLVLPEFVRLIPYVDAVRIVLAIQDKFHRVDNESLPPTKAGEERSFAERAALYELLARSRTENHRGAIFNSPWDARVSVSLAAQLAQARGKDAIIVVDGNLMIEWQRALEHLDLDPNKVGVLDLTRGTVKKRGELLENASKDNKPRIIFINPHFLHQLKPIGDEKKTEQQPDNTQSRKSKRRLTDEMRKLGWDFLNNRIGLLVVAGAHQLSEEAEITGVLRDLAFNKTDVMKLALTRVTAISGIGPLLTLLNFVDRNVLSVTVKPNGTELPFDLSKPLDRLALHNLVSQYVVSFSPERVLSQEQVASLPTVVDNSVPYFPDNRKMTGLFLKLINYFRKPKARKFFVSENEMIHLLNDPRHEALEKRIRERKNERLAKGEPFKFLVVTYHKSNYALLAERLKDLGALLYSGDHLEQNRRRFETEAAVEGLITSRNQWGDKGNPKVKGITNIFYDVGPRNPHDREIADLQIEPRSDVKEIQVDYMTAQTNPAWLEHEGAELTSLFREVFLNTLYEADRWARVDSIRSVMGQIILLGKTSSPALNEKGEPIDEKGEPIKPSEPLSPAAQKMNQLIGYLQKELQLLSESIKTDEELEREQKEAEKIEAPKSDSEARELTAAEKKRIAETLPGVIATEQRLFGGNMIRWSVHGRMRSLSWSASGRRSKRMRRIPCNRRSFRSVTKIQRNPTASLISC